MSEDNTAYWCTCADDPTTCLGCGIERLVLQVMGNIGHMHLKNRIMPLAKPPVYDQTKRKT
jgi:hypothetical protein